MIYNTESKKEEVKILGAGLELDLFTSIIQLPNGELFCYGSLFSGTTVIIDRSYGVRMLPSGAKCSELSLLYFDNNIYCFGGFDDFWGDTNDSTLSSKFDLEKNRWINLASLPKVDSCYHSVIFNRNILISGRCSNNLWLYSIEIDSFSIIPYYFKGSTRKFLIKLERLYLILWETYGWIYESEDEYHWKPISKIGEIDDGQFQMYCLYNKEKIYICSEDYYYQFDLKKWKLVILNKP